MLQILVNNTPLILDPKTKIRLEMNTSYFDVDEIKGDVVWHFDVPAAGNEETFEYAHYINVRNKKRAYDCVIKLHDMPIGRGKMLISTSKFKVFRVAVALNSFGVDFEDVSLKDAPYEPEQIGGSPHTEAAVLNHATQVNNGTIERDYRFPMVYAPQFYGSMVTTASVAGEHPEFNKDFEGFVNLWENNAFVLNLESIIDNRQCFVPFPMLVPVIKKALSINDYNLQGALNDEDDFTKLLLFSNRTLDRFLQNYFLYATNSEHIYKSFKVSDTYSIIPFEEAVNDEFNTFLNNTYLVKESGEFKVTSSLLAFQRADDGRVYYRGTGSVAIFKNEEIMHEVPFDYPLTTKMPPHFAITRSFNCEVDDLLTVRIKFWPDGYYGYVLLDESYIQVYKNDVLNGHNAHKNSFNIVDHIPSVNVTSLVNSLRNAFFMAVFFDDENKVMYTEKLQDVLSNNHLVDISEHLVKDSHELIPAEEQSVRLEWSYQEDVNDIDSADMLSFDNKSQLSIQYEKTYALLTNSNAVHVYDLLEGETNFSWLFYRHNFLPYGSTEASIKPTIKLSPMLMQEVDERVLPFSSKQALSQKIPEKSDDIGIQLLHWIGVTEIPEASSLKKMHVDFNGANGIVSKYGIEWLSFIASSEEFSVLLTDIDIWKLMEIQKLFLPKKKADHPRWVWANNVKALPKQATAEIDIRGVITAFEMKLVKRIS